MVSEEVRIAESDIDDRIRRLPIWNGRKTAILKRLMHLWRDALELAYMRFGHAAMFQNDESFEIATAIEQHTSIGVFWCIKWAFEYAQSSSRWRPTTEQLVRLANTEGVAYQALVDARENTGMVEYRRSAHAVFDIKYHLVWVTKYRYKILRGRIAERARDLVRQICEAREVVILRGAVSPDHIHMLVSAPAHLAPAKLVQYIKGRSSRRLQDEFPELRKRYWGQHLWARGYFCATVGAVDEETVKAYIENQKWDEDDQGFKITAPTAP